MERIGLFCASSNNMDAAYYEEATRFGKWLADHDKSLVYGGNNCGLMEATAKAVHENHGTVIGIVPEIIIKRGTASEYIDVTVECADLNDRKQLLLDKSDVIIVMPGGVGTLDEAFTVMASNTIGLHNKRLIFWNINGFWTELFQLFDAFDKKSVATKPWNELYTVANSFEEIITLIS